jgi:hypothetical protein
MAFWSNAYKICTNDPKIFCCKLINMSIKKHDLYPDLKFVDACVIKSVKKVLGKNAGKHSKTKIFKTGKLF